MKPQREQVKEHFIETLKSLDEDGEYEEITEGTFLIGDMNWRSIEVIYLSNAIQEHYGQLFPFNDLFEKIGAREVQDISVGEWVDFIHANLGTDAGGQGGAAGEASST